MGLFDKQTARTHKGLFPTGNDPYSLDNINKQIDNANTRIGDAGYSPQNADDRNAFEKFTNLPQHQNAFLDTLELLGRGGNAIKNTIDKSLTGDNDNLKSFINGLAGREKVTGSELAGHLGVENKVGKFALGLGLDIGLDPTTYIPGGVIAKGIGASLKPVGGLAKGAYNLAESASPALKTLRETRIEPAFNSAKDALGHAFVPQYKWDQTLDGGKDGTLKNLFNETNNTKDFMNENSMNDIGQIAKTTGMDAGKDVGRLAEKDLKQFEDVKGYEFPDGVTRTEKKSDIIDALNTSRNSISSLGKDINATKRSYESQISQTAQELDKIEKQLNRTFFSQENKSLRAINSLKNVPEDAQKIATEKAFTNLSPSPKFNYLLQRRDELKTNLDNLRVESTKVTDGKIDQIKQLSAGKDALKESIKNPVMIQKELPRPVREYSTDPAVLAATKNIVDSNDNLRQWATENDIPVGEIDGYMRHIWSQEEQTRRKLAGAKTVDRSGGNMSNPDKKVLSGRSVMGSAEDINDRLGRNHTEMNAYISTAIGQKKLIEYGNSVMFRRKILGDTNFARPFKEGKDIPYDAVVIDTNNYTFMKNDNNALPEQIGGKYVVTKGVKEALDRYQGIATDEGTKGMIKAFDTLQNTWKKMALFSVGFHIRNVAGAMFNNTLAGMNPVQLVKYTKEASGEVMNAIKGSESPLFTEYRKQGLSSSGISQVEFAKMGEAPEKGIIRTVESMSKTGKGKVIDKLKHPFQSSRELGDAGDQVNRFALFKWAVEEKGMSYADAAKKVHEVQYDYRDLTPFERNFVKRAIPFYTWSRKNIPFQLKAFVNDPRAFEGVNKVRLDAQSTQGLNDENTPDFMKSNFAIPVSKDKMLGLNLPLGDLTKLSSPLKTITDGISPVIKTPIEESLNYNFFKGKPIEKFAGQEKKYLGGLAVPAKLDYAIQAATGQIGRGLASALGDKGNVDQDTKFRLPSLGLSVVKPYDADKSLTFEQLAKLKQLQDYMLYIQQQEGEKPRTIAEIKKSQK